MNYKLLKELCETPSVAGREGRIRNFIHEHVKAYFDEIKIDPLGSLICKINSKKKNKKKILLLCHMDEIGFLVSHINSKGFVFVDPVGGFDPRNLFSRRVLICTEKEDIRAVMNPQGKPVHTQSPADRKKIPEPNEFFIDTGLGEKAKDKIKIGDFVVMDEPFLEMSEKIVSKAIKSQKKKGIKVNGPFPADTIFLKKNRIKYNVILGMYHDQVLTPFKALFEFDAINVTMGLPFLRVTPDHGPNKKMVGKNISSPVSLIKALTFLDKS